MPLKDIIQREIKEIAPLKLSRFMDLCLMHPEFGYYRQASPIGAKGDFITSPEISQLFGEMLGVFFMDLWARSGTPLEFNFIEFGPGKGTLLQDLLRVFNKNSTMRTGAHIFLLESNAYLEKEQREKLSTISTACQWYSKLSDLINNLSPYPTFFIGNEFLDVFPIDQYIFQENRWCERRIAYDDQSDSFVFKNFFLSASIHDIPFPSSPIPGTVMEISESQENFLLELLSGLKGLPYSGVFIDYGYTQGTGNSFQSVSNHAFVNPLENLGFQDLTAHVNFNRLSSILTQNLTPTPNIFGPISQGMFLRNLGIETRADRLISKNPERKSQIKKDLNRLTSMDEMGTLFKVLGITNHSSLILAGF